MSEKQSSAIAAPLVTTGFYFPPFKKGQPRLVRILCDQIYSIYKADQDDDFCYQEYEINSWDDFRAQYKDFIKLTLLEKKQNIYIHPDVFEFAAYWPGVAPYISLSIHPKDIGEYWTLSKDADIDDPRIIDVHINDPEQGLLEGRYQINKAYLSALIQTGKLSNRTHISYTSPTEALEKFAEKLRGDNYARAARFDKLSPK